MNMHSITTIVLSGAVLSGAFVAAPAMAEDFHVLTALSSPPKAMSDDQLSIVEGGVTSSVIDGDRRLPATAYTSSTKARSGEVWGLSRRSEFVRGSSEVQRGTPKLKI